MGGIAISSCAQDSVSSATGFQVPAAHPQGRPIRQAIPKPVSARCRVSSTEPASSSSRISPSSASQVARGPGKA